MWNGKYSCCLLQMFAWNYRTEKITIIFFWISYNFCMSDFLFLFFFFIFLLSLLDTWHKLSGPMISGHADSIQTPHHLKPCGRLAQRRPDSRLERTLQPFGSGAQALAVTNTSSTSACDRLPRPPSRRIFCTAITINTSAPQNPQLN